MSCINNHPFADSQLSPNSLMECVEHQRIDVLSLEITNELRTNRIAAYDFIVRKMRGRDRALAGSRGTNHKHETVEWYFLFHHATTIQ
ncbi:hypothetical protein D3C86_2050720 [compost metagenome]